MSEDVENRELDPAKLPRKNCSGRCATDCPRLVDTNNQEGIGGTKAYCVWIISEIRSRMYTVPNRRPHGLCREWFKENVVDCPAKGSGEGVGDV
ncbi:MAG: hypothetical protein ACYTEQ_01270 [Planctomycetota bacterium]|jgi:hypothetical protein